MPAPARISVPVKQPTPIKSTSNSTPKTPASLPRHKTRVVHRRRARGRLDDTDTDDELVREPPSDSETDSASSTLDSESISESEAEEESKSNVRVPSPLRTPPVNDRPAPSPPRPSERPSIFSRPNDWSDMVTEENANGAAALPVIDFADLSSHAQVTSPPQRTAPSPPTSILEQPETSQGVPGAGRRPAGTRKPGQSARQAYLTRLDSDPAYVPTLGQFWSHDDRLLDKDLRSLSGWWRGRWQGRGRGARGRVGFSSGWGMRGMRGRGGFVNDNRQFPEDVLEEEALSADREWTHDGFEELRKADEAKRQQYPFRGRGGYPRGRGGYRGNARGRGGYASVARSSSPHDSQVRSKSESQYSFTSDTLKFGNGLRPWFAMKPERVWTKQFDGYLYFEAQLKPVHNQGLGQGVRIKLPRRKTDQEVTEGPDSEAVVVRLPQRSAMPAMPIRMLATDALADRAIVVKLPSGEGSRKGREVLTPEDVVTVPPLPVEDLLPSSHSVHTPPHGTHLGPEASPIVPSRPHIPSRRQESDVAVSIPQASVKTLAPYQSLEAPQSMSEDSSVPNDHTSAGPSQLHTQPSAQEGETADTIPPPLPQHPVLPTLQTVVPPFQSSPPYGSPYGYTTPGVSLPPGIALSESGVTYEIATGRAVYLHTPPPPAPPPQMQVPMYNPRPMPMHHAHHGSVHFLPPHHAHGHAPSMSMSVSPPAFLSSPQIFALPRQSSRIEIRAPGEEKGKERQVENDGLNNRLPSTESRITVNVNAEPFTPASHSQAQSMGYYSAEAQQQAFDEAQRHHHQQSMSYQPASYYYPVGHEGGVPYGYGQQYSNVDAGQSQPFDTYGQEPYSQPTVYY